MAEPTIPLPKWAEDNVTDPSTSRVNVQEPPDAQKLSGWNKGQPMPRQWLNWLGRSTYRWLAYFRQENIDRVSELAQVNDRLLETSNVLITGSGQTAYASMTEAATDHFRRLFKAIVEFAEDGDNILQPTVISCKLVGFDLSNVQTVVGSVGDVKFVRHTLNKFTTIQFPYPEMTVAAATGTAYFKLLQADGSALPSKYIPASDQFVVVNAELNGASDFLTLQANPSAKIQFRQAQNPIAGHGIAMRPQALTYCMV